MLIQLKDHVTKEQQDQLCDQLKEMGVALHISQGNEQTLIGLVGDTSNVDIERLRANRWIKKVTRISEPYKRVNRRMHPQDTVIKIGDVTIGGGQLTLIAGPCSVESEDQMRSLASEVKAAGAQILRGGAFKPRTSPYSFQGLGADGIDLLLEAKAASGLPIISEIMDLSDLPYFKDVDILQVGARNMQNFALLKELSKLDKPILLKRGLSATYEEWLMSAEYLMSGGNDKIILCERGIRTFETGTRNTLDISAIPILRQKTHLPIIIDPSHAAGIRELVRPLSHAAVAAGADGVMIEVHNNPEKALCDGPQSLPPEDYEKLAGELKVLHRFCRENLSE
ncbi:MAG: 3-deoxy-7-phosphoheptulonate synthase [Clostridiales bacterium]|nr:3-deoxy-7-phosphoheptulonate synthase [Clostridiales bacterium]